MHIPDGFLDPKTYVGTAAAAAPVLAYAVHRTRRELKDRQVPLMGVMGAFIFAAQMINFPIIGGTSGHLIGAVLATILFGPWAAVLLMTTVLALQCFVFLDGGVTALGANILNMAVIAPLVGWGVFRSLRGLGMVPATFVASWASVLAAAAAASVELALSGRIGLGLNVILPAMLFWHVFIGLGEGLITGALVAYLDRAHAEVLPRALREPAGKEARAS